MTDSASASTNTSEPLPLTGERTVPGIAEENYWFRRHEIVYHALAPRCAGKIVVDAGFGEGYGADLIARQARTVIGLDYDQQATEHVARRYPAVSAARANLAALPLADGSIDVVINLQVIEHLWDQVQFIRECARVLRPGGELLISTPNRITFSPGRDTPLNPFHTRELNGRELEELLIEGGLRVTSMEGVHHGPRLAALDERHGGSLIDRQLELAIAGIPWPDDLAADVAGVTAEDFDIRPGSIDDSLDLLAIAVKQ
ncbi:class I SAM-dependent methyltransferase [Lolliginicoccus suaedae]|uniref:class I SAM-dependent methyltransferase n=1 Tax=Lolliginicoccus suaedae TaxID=2605429 RepID=UPI0011EBA499|nr:class I SAM-dependent methyltransferase [Lolliginicoccus suaedae]